MSTAKRNWTSGEIRYLRLNWPAKSDQEIGKSLGRSPASVQQKRYDLDIRIDPADWTAEEDAYIREHWTDQTDEQTAAALGKAPHAVYQRGVSLGLFRRATRKGHRNWTAEEIDYLQDKWGSVSVPTMSKKLSRTESAIKNKAVKLGLGAFLAGGDYITLNQLLIAVTGGNAGYSYKTTSWVKNRGMPIHTRVIQEKRVRVVYLEEFWDWAEKNRSFLDFSKMEPLALGEEPEWVEEQRRKDCRAFANQRKDPWTPGEDERLRFYLKQHKYGYAELSDLLHRSAGAIQRRCTNLGLKERPVKADNHGKDSEWTEEDYQVLSDGIRSGDSYTEIGRAVGRSEKAVRGKVYFVYLTENADKVRAMMGNGPWGHGAPTPTVKQGANLSRCRTSVKKDIAQLAGLIRYRMNELGYEPYWQRHMCMNWDDNLGCTAGSADCDSCAEFRRIRPQYCARCGGTFYERYENRFCHTCRKARKNKQIRKSYRQKQRSKSA